MPRHCSICGHKDNAVITKSALAGATNVEIAALYAVTASSVQRHRLNCLHAPRRNPRGPKIPPPKGAKARNRIENQDGRCPTCDQLTGEGQEALTPEAIVKRAERILHVSESIALKAQDADDSRLALLAVDRCQRSIDTLAKIAGLLKPDVTVIDQRQTLNVYASWPTEALEALTLFHAQLASGATIEGATRAVLSPSDRPQAIGAIETTGE